MVSQMNPIFFNSSSNNYSPYPNDFHHEDHHFLSPTSQASSSSISLTTHMFSNSNIHDQHEVFDRELQPLQHQHEGDNLGSQVYNDHRVENNNTEKSDEFPKWNKSVIDNINNDQTQMKWMSSKMRVMLKMKKSDPVNIKFYSSSTKEVTKLEDHKSPISPMEETDNSSNSTSSNNSIPIRVCSDCNTTKTPLWRSGPCGPKSLCNACGIRQRKARRAMAVAAAAENGTTNVFTNQRIVAPLKVTKTQHKDHKKPKIGHVTKYKKRQFCKQISTTTTTTTTTTPTPSLSPSPSPLPSPSMSPSSSSPARKNCVEDFLVNLSKNLTCYRVFPQDEKEAAILLMAISCGYAHET